MALQAPSRGATRRLRVKSPRCFRSALDPGSRPGCGLPRRGGVAFVQPRCAQRRCAQRRCASISSDQ
ncbi:Hypothetical protein CAP_8898 [Chondromyces apiculatus DSM 436]|uniref:Uncharacterized protein n=1 Tax=Chondromyces apiculatus DSM 436 TaxID=1192034 RepID=A0A017SX23_9BACT|nr:Hypothetical protein CAP_8898 [Chondromyces apiculatus DSM 436]